LETQVAKRYFVSPVAAKGALRRAGPNLHPRMKTALEANVRRDESNAGDRGPGHADRHQAPDPELWRKSTSPSKSGGGEKWVSDGHSNALGVARQNHYQVVLDQPAAELWRCDGSHRAGEQTWSNDGHANR